MIEHEKAKPGTFLIGVSTPTSQVTAELLNMMAGIKIQHSALSSGGTTQITGCSAGDIPLGMESVNVALPLWRAPASSKSSALTGGERLSLAPEIPTIARDAARLRPRHLAEHRRAGENAAGDREQIAR